MKKAAIAIKTLLATIVVLALVVVVFAFSGIYPVSVGSGHTAPIAWLLETTRERSVAVRSADLTVPSDLDEPARIAAGAGHYDSMCAGCHGKPGQEPADAFEPRPPALYEHRVEPREAFWTVKHGLKMTAMPSHLDHSDEENWDTVAFVRALPDMSSGRYRELTENATHDHGEGGGHSHGADPDSSEAEPAGDQGHDHGAEDQDRPTSSEDGDHSPEMEANTPQQALEGFRHALVEGRRDDTLAYLHPRATIIEGGTIQAVEEYAAGHLGSDMAFLGEMDIEQLSRDIQIAGDQATIETRSRLSGTFKEQTIDLVSTEYATLVQTDDGWKISQVAWSSQPFETGESSGGQSNGDQNAHDHSGDHDHDH